MQLQKQTPFQALNKSYARLPMAFAQMDKFKENLNLLFGRINEQESEENLKNIIADFLKNTFYLPDFEVNTKGRNDLVIHEGRSSADPVGVIIEAKKPSNRSEMISFEKPNSKALHELVLYYLREKIEANNHKIKYLIATNVWEWYIFDENEFEKHIFRNSQVRKDYQEWKTSGKDTAHFYKHIAQPLLEGIEELPCCYFNLLNYKELAISKVVREDTNNGEEVSETLRVLEENTEPETPNPDLPLVYLYKLFSPEHLLKKPFANDANSLNTEFYFELLHVLGLEEKQEDGILKIKRKTPKNRQEGSWLENTIRKIESTKRHETLPNLQEFGENEEDQLFSLGLELTITWLNRVLFLKLLEGQLIRYHRKNQKYAFLNIDTLADFDELEELFFEVLAVPTDKRSETVKRKFGHLPYLNSALFEITDLEQKLLTVGCLKDRLQLPLYQATVLKDEKGKQIKGEKPTLVYLFEFLNAFDFGSHSNDILQEKPKTIINAAVLGKIFEKLNGYAEGSVFTPHFITEYMCRETVRKAIVRKFQENKNPQGLKDLASFETFEDLKEALHGVKKEVRHKANEIFNSLRICDPAVGSGHFLVSVLNELLLAKIELEILHYEDGSRIRDFEFSLINEEIYFVDCESGEELNYHVPTELAIKNLKRKTPRQLLQEALFHEKQTLIENCLFGVDINPKSVMICRLRLWIELLKNAYYTFESHYRELQTLPNIDINIKVGNSLVSKFGLNEKNPQGLKDLAGLRNGLRNSIERYKLLVQTYKQTRDQDTKRDLRRQIGLLKQEFEKIAIPTDKDLREMRKKEGELAQIGLSFDGKYSDLKKLEVEINQLHENYKQKLQTVYRRAFEWRFEFPEILDEDGNFEGFDAIVGNPPYISAGLFKVFKPYLEQQYEVFDGTADLLTYFIELAYKLIKPDAPFSMVVSNKFSRANYGKKLREFISQKTEMHHYINFSGFKVFEAATVDVSIVGFSKRLPSKNNTLIYSQIEPKIFKFMKLDTIRYVEQFFKIIPQNELSSEVWSFESEKVRQIKQKVEQQGVPLKEWNIEIVRGVVTGLNEAFVIEEKTKDELIAEDVKSAEILKPLLRGRDLHAYKADYQNIWLIGTFPALKLDIENYPAIKNYFLRFGKERLEQTGNGGSRKKTGNQWFETQDQIAYWQNFEKPKIIYPNMTKFLPFVYDESGFYTNQKCYIITGKNLKYLVAILNSKLFKYCFRDNFPELLGGTRELGKVFFELIPIKKLPENEQKPFVELVDRILEGQKNPQGLEDLAGLGNDMAEKNPQGFENLAGLGNDLAEKNPQGLENLAGLGNLDLLKQIDALVYQLYGLTAEEIREIEK